MGDLLGFKMVIILPIFQMLGIVLCRMEWLDMSVRALMATGILQSSIPRCHSHLCLPNGGIERALASKPYMAARSLALLECPRSVKKKKSSQKLCTPLMFVSTKMWCVHFTLVGFTS